MSLDHDDLLRETHRLVQENNRMLRRMRRSAFWGGLFKFVFWTAVLVAPVWFYLTYLNGAVQNLLQAVNKIEGTSQQASTQFQDFQNAIKQLEQKIPGFSASSQ